SCIKQFWSTAKVKTVNDEVRVQALIDAKRVNIKESSIHRTLKLDDEEGTSCLGNDQIFTGLANMGYEKISEKLTFYKAFFSPQWKFLIHNILQCLSAKTTSCNEFSSAMASAIICLATKQKFNFSRYILRSLVKNKEAGVPFYMFPRFVQLIVDHQLGDISHQQDIYDNPPLTKKVFANMKRVSTGFSRLITPLFENMLVPAAKEVAPKVPSPEPSPEHTIHSPSNDPIPDANKDSLKFQELMDLCTRLSNKVLDLESKVIDIKSSFTNKIEKLEDRGRMIADMDEDVEVNLEETQAKAYNLDLQHSKKFFSIQDIDEEEIAEVEKVLEVVAAAKLITTVVTTDKPTTTTAAQVPKASAPKRRRGVVIQDPKKTTASVIMHIEQDEAFARQLEAELNANISWNDVIEQVKRSERQNNAVVRYQALKRKPLAEAQARKNMMIYLKNMVGFKMKFFKGMTYSEIKPLFEKHYNSIQAFLEKVEEEVTVQEKKIEEEGNKRQEATPLASKVHVVDYQIHHENNKPYYKIIKEDGTHKFDSTEPKNFSDDFLLNILKIIFEKPVIEANVWKDQKGRYGLAKKKYPLTHFTLEQMLNNVRLEVKEESEISLELLSDAAWNYYY
nr:hypothetical protein [Tanacetum cinerariifolium]